MSGQGFQRVSRRSQLLEAAGMGDAPRPLQRAFWQSYNRLRRERTERCDLLLGKMPLWNDTAATGPLAKLRAAWDAVLPACYAGFAEAEWFRGGRLRVRVDSAGTQFVMTRLAESTLLAALNERVRPLRVREIYFRVARGGGGGMNGRDMESKGI